MPETDFAIKRDELKVVMERVADDCLVGLQDTLMKIQEAYTT